ncbi:hypothetical protein SPOG_02988 [Schizosaccharomyces cryophilus OY26]|uniref:Inner centromere protein ARK-binding domain-containing protein n=1 Tax=Schizosaccharomyces cryophilus (strain OY26 / ATCC MYA-4695 / CBS 11777 / NBRC 106824 / NRRL Y48691) TaxID=653667 RepID=S9W195_SCHCR|nr:uncharacterized protein SPOG_02988 [Schizosaccharomyces cryophilus OY26]EPY53778.1 hypothetical protein SPOG_02988 [Schizosaccharomyces cryophilus OY26]
MSSLGSGPWFSRELEHSHRLMNEKTKEFSFLVSETMDWLNEHMLEVSKLRLEGDLYTLAKTPNRIKEKYTTPRLSPVRRCELPTPRMQLSSIQQQLEQAAEGKEKEKNSLRLEQKDFLPIHTEEEPKPESKPSEVYVDNSQSPALPKSPSPVSDVKQPDSEHQSKDAELLTEIKKETPTKNPSPASNPQQFTEWDIPLREPSPSPIKSTASPSKSLQNKHPAYSFVHLPKREDILRRPASLQNRADSTNSFLHQLNRRLTKESTLNTANSEVEAAHPNAQNLSKSSSSSLTSPSRLKRFLSSIAFGNKTESSKQEPASTIENSSPKLNPHKRSSDVAAIEDNAPKNFTKQRKTSPEMPSSKEFTNDKQYSKSIDVPSRSERPASTSTEDISSHDEQKLDKQMDEFVPLMHEEKSPLKFKSKSTSMFDRAEKLRQQIHGLAGNRTEEPSTPPGIKKPVSAVLDAARNSTAKDLQLAKLKIGGSKQESPKTPNKSHVKSEIPKIPSIAPFTKLSTKSSVSQQKGPLNSSHSNSETHENALESHNRSNISSNPQTSEKSLDIAKETRKLTEAGYLSTQSQRPVAIRVATASQRELEQTERRKAKATLSSSSTQTEFNNADKDLPRASSSLSTNSDNNRKLIPMRQMKTSNIMKSVNSSEDRNEAGKSPEANVKEESVQSQAHINGDKQEKLGSKRLVTNATGSNWNNAMIKRQEESRRRKLLAEAASSKSKPGLTRVTSKPTLRPTRELLEDKSLALHYSGSRKIEGDTVTSLPISTTNHKSNNESHTNDEVKGSQFQPAALSKVGFKPQTMKPLRHNFPPPTKPVAIKENNSVSNTTALNNRKPTNSANTEPTVDRKLSGSQKLQRSPLVKTPKTSQFTGYDSYSPNASYELPDIDSDYLDESDDEEKKKKINLPSWAESPELQEQLKRQQKWDPDKIFGSIKPLHMDELFKSKDRSKLRFRPRSSSADWSSQDRLTQAEIDNYKRNMGYL